MAIKEGFGKYGLAEKDSQGSKAETKMDKSHTKENSKNLRGKRKENAFSSFNKTRNSELHYGSRTNY